MLDTIALQNFGCARLKHLQILFGDKYNNYKINLSSNMISKKDDIFVHNTRKIDNKMLVALDVLCKFKYKLSNFYAGYNPVIITFLSTTNELYHIIVADKENQKEIVKLVNTYPFSLPKADKLILMFPGGNELENIDCEIPFIYSTYPEMEILNR